MIVNRSTPSASGKFNTAVTLIKENLGPSANTLTPSDFLFFDIETTGLSPATSYLYLIGCMYLDKDIIVHEQFFSEGINEEAELIEEFDRLLSFHKVLVHFNGQTFDIPYIDKKRTALGIPSDITFLSFDIFRYLRPFKKFLGLNSMSQKSLELYCGLNRKDIYDGGELIDFYNRYIAIKRLEELRSKNTSAYRAQSDSGLTKAGEQKSAELLNTLLLHNYEDVLGMLDICAMLSLPALCRGAFTLAGCTPSPCGDSLEITLVSDYSPRKALKSCHRVSLADGSIINIVADDTASRDATASGNGYTLRFSVPVHKGELKLFYPNYKDYYYLPAEDSAIHKSIGEFLDKSLRIKCNASNCYTRHCLDFLPLPCPLCKDTQTSFTVFKKDVHDRFGYVNVAEVAEAWNKLAEYVKLVFSLFLH